MQKESQVNKLIECFCEYVNEAVPTYTSRAIEIAKRAKNQGFLTQDEYNQYIEEFSSTKESIRYPDVRR